MNNQLDYGNWIRKKNLAALGACALGMGALLFIPLDWPYRIGIAVLFALLTASFVFPLYAYVMFSQKGGRLQGKFYDLIIRSLGQDVKGKILDIGSGNGVLAIELARQNSNTDVTGVDFWGTDWEYSKSVCEKNARIAGVENRVHFQKGDAARLDFSDGSFDGVTSNLTFHEVRSAPDKRTVLCEALRPVKAGGSFAFIDYFYDEKYYGKQAEFEKFLGNLNLAHYEFRPLREMIEIPALMAGPQFLGKVGIIYGRK